MRQIYCAESDREVQPHFLCDNYEPDKLKFATGKVIIEQSKKIDLRDI